MMPPMGVTPATRNAPGTGHRKQLRIVVDRDVGARRRIDAAQLLLVERRADGVDLLEAEHGHRRKERRVDVLALDRPRRELPGSTAPPRRDRGDLAVAHDDRASGDLRAGDGMDRRADDREGPRRRPSPCPARRRQRSRPAGRSRRAERRIPLHRAPPSAGACPAFGFLAATLAAVGSRLRPRFRDQRRALGLERRARREVGRAVEVLLPVDPGLERDGRGRERISAPDHEVGVLARLERADRARRCRAASPG